MDELNLSAEAAEGLKNLSVRDRQELQQFVAQETQKAQIQSAVHMLTDKCFKKCITSKITSGALDRSEEPCMRNCVDRFMDASGAVIRHLEQMRQ
ncbi:unnamed protein product [Zymoseptoria tritici ST99CH_1A5]|uniref:Mitochondrial import inner membrane translocase subunit n=5 Tax=Zymoseptoria TaxID=1047167 RepID=A0A0F4GRQ1_9PEZI|nr:uncharacterized protein MYCGRDRAFT_74555 [Zymoseptoria tritici IPO323]KJY00082.1 mitochondrial import inner membrane translocase subunit tim8 like protein [Zymoseptoria brevis]SMQ53202.1 unnamed protein product [Zymoseptoria tritici ST99CH_3D7]SMR56785.1 unnamed protein product [Zymoseptoria tritici ST99CH_1E4]SMR59641.1 unnamed protein product [Zymoseptoria tritici ST99CH_3D1]SMY26834.1 unnamed protein product [Zymoseptoria tritici ST99CH_1A5]